MPTHCSTRRLLRAAIRPRDRSIAFESLERRTLPSIDFGMALGIGAQDIRALAVANDVAGNVLVTGTFQGTADFDPGPGTTSITSGGDYDLFVAKYSSTGALVWARTFLGGSTGSVGEGDGIAIDGSGNCYLTGEFSGPVDFDPGPGTLSLSSLGRFDCFVAKLDGNGNLVWARDLPGSTGAVDCGTAIVVDGLGQVAVTGRYQGTATFGSTTLTSAAATNLFVARFDASGNSLWAQGSTGSGTSSAGGTGVAVDASGHVDVSGFFSGYMTFGASGPTLSSAGLRDMFVAQYSSTGNLVWGESLGGSDFDQASAIAVDGSANIYTTGAFAGTVDFDPGSGIANLTSGGSYSVFIVKLTSAGQLVWAKALTISSGAAMGTGIAVDSGGRVDTTGWFQSTVDFDPGPATAYLTSAGFEDVFLCELDSNGNYLGALRAGGIDFDAAAGLAVNSSGAIALGGGYIGPSAFGSTTLANLGIANMFVAETVPPPVPPPPPSSPDLEAASDSGVSATDNLTNVAAPTFDVTVADSTATVQLLRDEVVVGSRMGPGAVADPGPVPAGIHSYTARQQSAAGVLSLESAALAVTFDFAPPATPPAPALLAADDSGTLGDGITNMRQPHLTGTAEAGSLVQVITGTGSVLGTAVAAAGGSYSVLVASALADGAYALHVNARDAAGNLSANSPVFNLVIDATPPAVPAAPALLAADDSGTLGDGITNVRQPHLTGTAEAGSLVRLVSGTGATLGTTTAAADGSYLVQVTSPLSDGTYILKVSAQDAAGNVSALSAGLWLTIDTSTPTAPALWATDDSGIKGDGVTNVRQPHLVGWSQPLFTIQVVDGSGLVRGSAPAAADGSYTVQLSSPLSDGAYALRVQAVDASGTPGPASPPFALVIDTVAPAAPAAPALLAADDSGTPGDGITNVRQPHLTGTAEAGATVQLITGTATVLGTAVAASNGSYTVLVQSLLADGLYALQARAQDAAGNQGSAGPAFSLTIDTTPPATPPLPTLLAADDSGTPGDGITNVRQPHLTGTAEPGSLVRLVDGTGTTLGTTTAAVSGSYTVQVASPLADGSDSLAVRAQDAAGNASAASGVLLLKIDGTAPAAPGPPALLAADDSGAKLDGITSVRQPHLTGSTEPLATVRVLDSGGVLRGATTAAADGSYTLLVSAPLADGAYDLSALAGDVAGNWSSPGPIFHLVIDTVAPAIPTVPVLAPGDDTGTSGDRITSVRQPHFLGSAEPGSELMLLNAAGVPLGTAVAAPDRSYSVQVAAPLGDGSYSLAAQAQDAAGNLSALSSRATFTIDTTAPAPPAAPALAPGDDSGALGDGTTNVRQPHLAGTAEPGSLVQLLDGANHLLGSSRAAADGTFAVQPASAWSDGTYLVHFQAEDAAGNVSGSSGQASIRIDTIAPAAPAAPTVLASDDTGIVGDGILTTRRPHLVGTAEAGSTVELLDGSGQIAARGAAATDGSYTLVPANDLPLGRSTWRVQARDAAGNQGPAGPTLTLDRITVGWDEDGDGRTDLAVYRQTTAQWLILGSRNGGQIVQLGTPGLDQPVPADYDGTGRTELAVFRPTTAQWFIQGVSGVRIVQFGAPGDIPVPADYDGDGKADLAVFRPSTAQWFIWGSTSGPRMQQFGAPNLDIPVAADYDGDGKADLAVFRPTTAQWFILRTSAGGEVVPFGAGNLDRPIPADYDGDGKADVAVFRPTTAQWFLLRTSAGGEVVPFGAGNLDQPIPADYDGDGKADVAVFRPTTAQWFVFRSTAGPALQQFGAVGIDTPLPLPVAYRWAGGLSTSSIRPPAALSPDPLVVLDRATEGSPMAQEPGSLLLPPKKSARVIDLLVASP